MKIKSAIALCLALLIAGLYTVDAVPLAGKAAMLRIASRDTGYSADAFVMTIETAGANTFTLPTRSGYTYNCAIDWGDGDTSAITAYDDAGITHSYDSAGTWTITIEGTFSAIYFDNSGDKLLLRTVEQWGNIGLAGEGLYNAFYGCANATSFGDRVTGAAGITQLLRTWYNCSSLVTPPAVNHLTEVSRLFYTWRGCSGATSMPDVDQLTEVTSIMGAWYDCSLVSTFPEINTLTNVTDAMFAYRNCTGADSFPSMSNLTKCTSIRYTWNGTNPTTVPVLPAASTALINTEQAFSGIGAGMTGAVVELWNATNFPNITTFGNTFTGATGLDNYADIPDSWKGL